MNLQTQEIKREITIQLHLLNSKGSRLECIEEKTQYLNVIQSSNKTFTGKIFKTFHRNRR
jgi:hypothetical protein